MTDKRKDKLIIRTDFEDTIMHEFVNIDSLDPSTLFLYHKVAYK